MGTFAVKIDNAEYEVDAPDEATAWKYANAEHGKPYDIPAGLKSAMNIGQAVSFGFGDEIAGALGADKSRYNATLERFRGEYPGSAMLGTVAGSMLLPGAAGKAFANAPYMAAATTGVATGALQGAGDAKDVGSIPNDASKAALIGGAAGPMVLGMAKPVGSVMSALSTKLPMVGDDLAKNLARRQVARAFERDTTTADTVGQKMVKLGGEARVGDAAGESTRGLLDLNANLPGKTANELESTIRNRIQTRPDRMDDVVYSVNGGVRARSLENAINEQQQQIAAPLYQKAHSADLMPSPSLSRDLEAARRLGAFGEAEKRSLANPTNGPFSFDPAQQFLGKGKVAVRDIDHVKQGIDSLIEANTDAVTGKVSGYGRDLVSLKKRILAEVDSTVPDYAKARQAYAGPAAMQTAMTKGKAFWNEKADRLADTVADMTESEQQAFRIGAAEALREKVGSQSGQNQLLNLWKDRNTKEKLQALLGGDVKYSEVEKLLKNESTLKRMEGLGPSRNSRTFSREANSDTQSLEVGSDVLGMGVNAKTGNWLGLAQSLMKNSSRVGTPEPVRDEIGRILLQKYMPEEMKALMAAQEAIRKQKASASAGAGLLSGKVAGQRDK